MGERCEDVFLALLYEDDAETLGSSDLLRRGKAFRVEERLYNFYKISGKRHCILQ